MRFPPPIGFFGGTFDPVHRGHLEAAEQTRQLAGLATVTLIPASVPPHRPAPVATAGERLRMLQLALADFPALDWDDREMRRAGPSYTVLTLRELRAEHPAVPLCLIVGTDVFAELPSWYEWQIIPRLVHLLVMRRPGWPRAGAPAAWWRDRRLADPAGLAAAPAGRVCFIDVTPIDISASAIRRELAAGIDPGAVLSPAVAAYIHQHALYRNEGTRH